MMKIKLRREQIKGRQGAHTNGILDITVKSATGRAKRLAPTWDMVTSYKNGTMSEEQYTQAYHDLLEHVADSDETMNFWLELHAWGAKCGGITFLCYCRNGAFCHINLLIDWLVSEQPIGRWTDKDGNHLVFVKE